MKLTKENYNNNNNKHCTTPRKRSVICNARTHRYALRTVKKKATPTNAYTHSIAHCIQLTTNVDFFFIFGIEIL